MRFDVLDGWRGIAALMVAVFHFNALHHGYDVPFVRNSYLFVDFFFVLSGFVIAHAYAGRLGTTSDAAAFAVRRFGRVWPLHVAVLAGFAALETVKWIVPVLTGAKANIAAFDPAGQMPLAHLPAQITLTHALDVLPRLTWNNPSWSISAEFWTYLMFAAVTLMAPRRRILVLAALAVLSATMLVSHARHGMDASFDLGLPRCIFGFVTGVLVYEARPHLAPFKDLIGSLEWLSLAISAVFVSHAGTGQLSFAAPLVFAAVVAVFSFEAGTVSRTLQTPQLHALGQWSYSIYMVHDLAVSALMLTIAVLEKPLGLPSLFIVLPNGARVLGGVNPFVLDGMLICYLAVVIVLARFTYRTIEDPGRTLFNRLSRAVAVVPSPLCRRPAERQARSRGNANPAID